MNFILYSFRRYHQLNKEDVANCLQLSIEKYSDLESTTDPIESELAQKFSDFYKAPKHLFLLEQQKTALQVVFNHSYFENSNGYVQDFHSESSADNLINQQNKFIAVLQAELERLESLCKSLQKRIDG